MVPALLQSTGLLWLSSALLVAAFGCAARRPAAAPHRVCDADDAAALCDYGPAPTRPPASGFAAVQWDDEASAGPAPWGGKWERGDELVWVTKSRAPDYPVIEGGLRLRVEATRACQGQVPGVRKSFTLPPMDTPTSTIVQFFTIDGRAYQVGYGRPSKLKPSKDVLDFMSRFCGE